MSKVTDHGPSQYASGTVTSSYYTVVKGDTPYSIGQRFGLPYQEIFRANGLPVKATIYPEQKLLIPGLGQQPPAPPLPTGPSRLGINSPTYGSFVSLQSPVIVSGIGANLPGNRVIVRIKSLRGNVASRKETFIDREGNWSVTFATGLPLLANTTGTIQAATMDNKMKVDVAVQYR